MGERKNSATRTRLQEKFPRARLLANVFLSILREENRRAAANRRRTPSCLVDLTAPPPIHDPDGVSRPAPNSRSTARPILYWRARPAPIRQRSGGAICSRS